MKILPLFSLLLVSGLHSIAAGPRVLLADSFTIGPERAADSDLNRQLLEVGGVAWKRSGNLAISADGRLTAAGTGGSVATVPLPDLSDAVCVEADLAPVGSGFIALAFMERGDLNFWSDTPLWMSLWPSGRCEVRKNNEILHVIGRIEGHARGAPVHVEFIYDPVHSAVSLKLNGALVLDRLKVPGLPSIGFAALRFQEPLKPGVPQLDNFKVSIIDPSQIAAAPPAPAPAAAAPGGAAPAPKANDQILLADTFTPEDSAEADNLDKRPIERGGRAWRAVGNLVVTPEGRVTASGGAGSVAIVPLAPPTGPVSLHADLNPAKSGFLALCFMTRGDLNFWNDTPLWMTLWPTGKADVRAGNDIVYANDSAPMFQRGAFNHVELIYDPAGNTVSLKINEALLADRVALPSKVEIRHAGFRFQEPLTPGAPALDNFMVIQNAAAPAGAAASDPEPALAVQAPGQAPSRPVSELIGDPIWASDIVANEPLLFIDSGNGPVARLLFPPEEILSVRSSTLEKSYRVGADLIPRPGTNVVTLPAGSPIPSLKVAELFPSADSKLGFKSARGERAARLGGERLVLGAETAAPYFSRQILVTYRHKSRWSGYKPAPAEVGLARSLRKLRDKEPFKLVFLGDSISAGCFASGNLKFPPFQPAYTRIVPERLGNVYGGDIKTCNLSKGGQVANFALSKVPLLISEKPDLIVLAFGMNDGSARVSPQDYGAVIERTVAEIRKGSPGTEFILVATIVGNPEWSDSAPDLYPRYRDKLRALVGPGVALADMTALSTELLATKTYADITVNGVNHPNDFGHRLYAQSILELLKAN